MNLKKTATSIAIGAAIGAAAIVPQAASAVTMEFSWDGVFTMLTSAGAALANTSNTTKGANQYQTAVTGTMAFDTVTGAGTATLVPFDFYDGSLPAEAVGINMQAIGDGAGGAGTLVLGNMLFNWNGTSGIPVSIVLDAAGFFGATSGMWGDGTLDQTDVAGYAAVPASDGTYVNATFGYLGLGPVPMATTEWNVTQATACGTALGTGSCLGVSPSGVLPLVADTAVNTNEYAQGDGVGIGGVPMWDGPFTGFSANFDVLSLTLDNPDAGYSIPTFTEFFGNPVPVPAAVWLFGSGLVGLVGVARRKKQA